MNKAERIVLAGGSGFVGRSLATALIQKGYEVIVLTRNPSHQESEVHHVKWDGLEIGHWTEVLEGAQAVVNLTGKNVNCRHTPNNRREIFDSRANSVRILGKAITQSARPPEVFVQVSGTGIYGDAEDRWCDENAPHGEGFLADVSRAWEGAFDKVHAFGMRKSLLRLGPVLGPNGGILEPLARLTRWFLGGHIGNGRQFLSWIHISDLTLMFIAAIEQSEIAGVFNAVAPNPVSNAEFMHELRRALHRPWSPPVPAVAAKLGAWIVGTDASLALGGQRCTPKRFLNLGFDFDFPKISGALEDVFPGE